MIEIQPVEKISGTVTVPGSKSYTNRALLIAALADGVSRLEKPLVSDDTKYMIRALKAFGVTVQEEQEAFIVSGKGGKLLTPDGDIFIGNAGTAMRFLTTLSALAPGKIRLDGDERMRERPVADLLDCLTLMGVHAVSSNKNGCPPIDIAGGESGTLSGEVVIGAGLTMNVGTGATTGQGSIESLKVSNTFTPPIGGINERPSAPQPGALYYNKDFRTIEYWDGNFWRQVDNTTRSGRGVFFGGGWGPAPLTDSTLIDYIQIPTLGNAVNFGSLATATTRSGACSSSIRGLCGGGSFPNEHNVIQYVTIASSGNAIDFGDLTGENNERAETSALSSSTRGVWGGGGQYPDSSTNIMDYVEIMTLGNALDFGDLTQIKATPGAVSNGTRGVFMGGAISTYVANIDYMTIASKGNATVFGSLAVSTNRPAGFSNRVRGFSAGGPATGGYQKLIQYITIASTGNSLEFGDLSNNVRSPGGTSNQIRGIIAGGLDPSVYVNTIEYITIATSGNASDFGDLTQKRFAAPGCSDSHGGLGGF